MMGSCSPGRLGGGLGAVLIVSLAYGYGLRLLADSAQCPSSPGFAALGIAVLGILAGALILLAISIVNVWFAMCWHAARPSVEDGARGCTLITVLAVTAAVVGFLLGARPLFHLAPPR